jgi:hypothetical protein
VDLNNINDFMKEVQKSRNAFLNGERFCFFYSHLYLIEERAVKILNKLA